MSKLKQADYDFMARAARNALSQPKVIMGKPVNDAAEYIAIAQFAEGRMLRASFFSALHHADYYTENRAMRALILLDKYTNQFKAGTR